MTNSRDNFSAATRGQLGKRAAYVCAKPDCGLIAIEPAAEPTKATIFGEACHIAAAAEGGPRYDPEMTLEQRIAFENGIWLCASCHSKIDKDVVTYTVELLQEWKRGHETWVSAGGAVPEMPTIIVQSLGGFSVSGYGVEPISPEENEHGRETQILVELGGRGKIVALELECQMPEPIYRSDVFHRAVGVDLIFEPRAQGMMTMGSVELIGGEPPPPKYWRLAVGNLRPRAKVDLRIRSIKDPPMVGSSHQPDWPGFQEQMAKWNARKFWLAGTMSWEHRDAVRTRTVKVLLHYHAESRNITSDPATSEDIPLTQTLSYP